MVTGQTIALHPFDRPHLERTRAWVNDPELSRLLGRPARSPTTSTRHGSGRCRTARRPSISPSRPTPTGGTSATSGCARSIGGTGPASCGSSSATPPAWGAASAARRSPCSAPTASSASTCTRSGPTCWASTRARCGPEKAGFAVEGVLKEDRWDGDRTVTSTCWGGSGETARARPCDL